MTPRKGSRKVPLKGIYPGARVKRGHDWTWDNQVSKEILVSVHKSFTFGCNLGRWCWQRGKSPRYSGLG